MLIITLQLSGPLSCDLPGEAILPAMYCTDGLKIFGHTIHKKSNDGVIILLKKNFNL